MTTSTLTQLAPTQVALEFSIAAEDLSAAEDRAYRKLAKDVRLPGFRKGKVPRKIFEQSYGTEVLTREAVDEVLPQTYAKAIAEHNVDPVERPTLEILEEADGRPSRVKATVEVRPAIALGAYKGIAVPQAATQVTDDDVERSVATLAKERATLIPVQRPAQLGDVVTIDYEGTIDGVPFEGGRGESQVTELTEGRFIPGFVAGIVGMSAGERKTVATDFPANYAVAELAGKAAQFDVTLHEVKEYELPSLDDEFARSVSGQPTMAELKAELRRRMESVAAARARRSSGNAIITRLLREHDFPLPSSMVESEIDHMLEEAASPGGETDDSTSETDKRETYRAEAESRVKAALLIEAIAKAENISATPADLAAELEVLSRRYAQPVSQIRKALGRNLVALMDGIVRNKTLDFLVDNAAIVANEETATPAS